MLRFNVTCLHSFMPLFFCFLLGQHRLLISWLNRIACMQEKQAYYDIYQRDPAIPLPSATTSNTTQPHSYYNSHHGTAIFDAFLFCLVLISIRQFSAGQFGRSKYFHHYCHNGTTTPHHSTPPLL